MIRALAHVCLFSSDLARTEKFYCEGLGLTVKFRFLRQGALFGYYLAISDRQFIEVFQRSETPDGPAHIGHLCLEVDDLAALRQRLVSLGVEATEPKLGADHSWQMWIKDPDGTPIELHQYTAESSQFTGADCVVTWC